MQSHTSRMTTSTSTPLGPQCLLCKKRRVKCDSTKPTCQRCARDKRECPGYSKPLIWKTFCPEDASTKTEKSSSSIPASTENIIISSSTELDLQVTKSKPSMPLILARSLFTTVDKRNWQIADSLIYCTLHSMYSVLIHRSDKTRQPCPHTGSSAPPKTVSRSGDNVC